MVFLNNSKLNRGYKFSSKKTQAVFNLFQTGRIFAYVITVCDETSAERCPIFPGITKRFHWSFPDPPTLTGTEAEKLAKMREVRDLIKVKIANWCHEMGIPLFLNA